MSESDALEEAKSISGSIRGGKDELLSRANELKDIAKRNSLTAIFILN